MKRRTFLATAAGASTALALGATGTAAGADTDALLRRWFRDTYRSIEALTTDFGLAADTMDVTASTLTPSVNTSPTNIGCGLWATVAAGGLGVIDATTMHRRLARTVTAVERLERAHGFWFNWYDAYTGETLTTWPGSGDPVDPFLSSVDNAWLVTGLRIAADADAELRPRVARLLADADWSFYYTPYDAADPAANPGQLHGGYSTATDSFTPHWYGALNTEPRMASYLGIADGSLPGEHYWHTFRTLEPGAEQDQQPEGEWVTVDGVRLWRGHYTYRGRKIVPSWGGSMFEALMVPLFVPETAWSPGAWGSTTSATYAVRSSTAWSRRRTATGASPLPTFPRAAMPPTAWTPSAWRSTATPPGAWSLRTLPSSRCRSHATRRSPTFGASPGTSGRTRTAWASATRST